MSRMRDKNNIDSIKRTMQMHEDIFKQQVRELHRLYRVQRMLMDELKREIKQNTRYWKTMASNSNVKHSHFTTSKIGYSFDFPNLTGDQISRERTSSCSGETIRMTRIFDLEKPIEEDTSTGVRSMNVNHLQAEPSSNYMPSKTNRISTVESDEDSDHMELTLSIGSSISRKTLKKYRPLYSQQTGLIDTMLHKDMKDVDCSASCKSEGVDECNHPY